MNNLLESKSLEKPVDELQQNEKIVELLRLERRIASGKSAETGTIQVDYERLTKIKATLK